MNPFHVRTGSLIASIGLACLPLMAQAAATGPSLWFQGSRLILPTAQANVGDIAVAQNDPGLLSFLTHLGARLAYEPGQRYVVITTADRRQITFTVGEADFQVDSLRQSSPFPIGERQGVATLPFFTLARALDVAAITAPGEVVLEPQITTVDAHEDHGRTIVVLHGAVGLHPVAIHAPAGSLRFTFAGIGTSLAQNSPLQTPGLRGLRIVETGTPKNPFTTLTFLTNGSTHSALLRPYDPHGAVIALAPAEVALGTPRVPVAPLLDVSAEAPVPPVAFHVPAELPTFTLPITRPVSVEPTPSVQNSTSVVVANVTTQADRRRFQVHIATAGRPNYRWRILGDGRFFIDFPNAELAIPTRDDVIHDARVSALRIKANGTPAAPNVRLALNFVGAENVHVTSDAVSLTIAVDNSPDVVANRSGFGHVGGVDNSGTLNTGETVPVPGAELLAGRPTSLPIQNNPGARVIVLDPGHGGSDSGAVGNGLTEKVLTLDIARRLRTLLIARGWQVVMTRDSDVDVYAANDSAREELQARCDVANRLGAKLFVSIHINSFTSSDLRGTTTYYYKPGDEKFAQVVEGRLIAALGTQDDGARRENYYVVRHTTMPAILVETAFLSNSSDAARLNQPTFRQNVAEAIGDGITAYAGDTTNSSGTASGVTSAIPSALGVSPIDDIAP